MLIYVGSGYLRDRKNINSSFCHIYDTDDCTLERVKLSGVFEFLRNRGSIKLCSLCSDAQSLDLYSMHLSGLRFHCEDENGFFMRQIDDRWLYFTKAGLFWQIDYVDGSDGLFVVNGIYVDGGKDVCETGFIELLLIDGRVMIHNIFDHSQIELNLDPEYADHCSYGAMKKKLIYG